MESFFEKERLANAVRKKDISQLNYITIPFEKIPHLLHSDIEKEFFSFGEKTMVNLNGISNTDLKLQYGTANLALLSEYDTNYMEMIALLPKYTKELLDAGQVDTAQMLLEFAIDSQADSSILYKQLAEIYRTTNQSEKIEHLITSANTLPELTKSMIQKELSTMN